MKIMKIMNSSDFRVNMKKELNLIETSKNPLCITTVRKGGSQQMVIISKVEYDKLTNELEGK